ncbi:hypothetical protein EDC01DRAFT_776698 [Geopyxis carbonaria]|nr:hypothetical protein EDC01DRAFT_776698 [Geopyxis carbonaria]
MLVGLVGYQPMVTWGIAIGLPAIGRKAEDHSNAHNSHHSLKSGSLLFADSFTLTAERGWYRVAYAGGKAQHIPHVTARNSVPKNPNGMQQLLPNFWKPTKRPGSDITGRQWFWGLPKISAPQEAVKMEFMAPPPGEVPRPMKYKEPRASKAPRENRTSRVSKAPTRQTSPVAEAPPRAPSPVASMASSPQQPVAAPQHERTQTRQPAVQPRPTLRARSYTQTQYQKRPKSPTQDTHSPSRPQLKPSPQSAPEPILSPQKPAQALPEPTQQPNPSPKQPEPIPSPPPPAPVSEDDSDSDGSVKSMDSTEVREAIEEHGLPLEATASSESVISYMRMMGIEWTGRKKPRTAPENVYGL